MCSMAASTEFAEPDAAISACDLCGPWQLALSLLSLMTLAKVAVDTITYNAAISACAKGGQ